MNSPDLASDDIVVAELVENPASGLEQLAALTLAEASELTARIGRALEHAEVLIAEAYIRRAWEPLGLSSWNAYVDKFFGERPILTVPRQDRQTVVQSLSDAGLTGRAIGRAIGVDESTIRKDLKKLGAGNPAPDEQVFGAGVECPTCGELHPEDVGTCPYVEQAFGTIIGADHNPDDSERVFRRGPNLPDAEADDVDTDDLIDSEDAPLPDSDPDTAAADVSARVQRLQAAASRITVLRDDLDEMPDLLAEMNRDLADWPDQASAPPPEPAARIREQVAAIRTALPGLPGWLDDANTIADSWSAMSR